MEESETAVFDLGMAGCLNCKRAIEHAGRHVAGIKTIDFDIVTHKIHVVYDKNNEQALDKLKEIVAKIGYEATLVKN